MSLGLLVQFLVRVYVGEGGGAHGGGHFTGMHNNKCFCFKMQVLVQMYEKGEEPMVVGIL